MGIKVLDLKFFILKSENLFKNDAYARFCSYCVFCLFSAVVGIVIHPGEQFFGGAPDHVVAGGRARARV